MNVNTAVQQWNSQIDGALSVKEIIAGMKKKN